MKNKKWKKIITTYLLVVFVSLLLFFPIDLIVIYNGELPTEDIARYFIANFLCISIIMIIDINLVRYFNSIFIRNKMILCFFLEILCAIIISNIVIYIFQNVIAMRVDPITYFYGILNKDGSFYTITIEGIFIMVFIETIYMHYQRKETDLEREKFKYNQLKNQLNPHFLFNSLNILLAMVYKREPKESADFIEKLSDVYRYILSNDDKGLVLLKEEVDFISKYGEILKTRFNNGFILNINLREEDMKKKILLMSLQLLVENAVKHNIACEETPLVINIFSDNGFIVVSNNKNIRSEAVVSTGIGLKNLSQRYRIVTNKEIEVVNKDSIFKVIIPLI